MIRYPYLSVGSARVTGLRSRPGGLQQLPVAGLCRPPDCWSCFLPRPMYLIMARCNELRVGRHRGRV